MTARTPKAKAIVSGQALRNPARYRSRSEPKGLQPIGDPPASLTCPYARAYWKELKAALPWLKRSDRILLEMTCRLAARMDTRPEQFGVPSIRVLSSLLSKLGASPVDAARINFRGDPDDDPADQFFGKPN